MTLRAAPYWALLVLIVVCAFVPLAGQADDLVGSYTVSGRNQDGATYTGTAEIASEGEVYGVRWLVEPNAQMIGIGLREGDVLSVIFQMADGSVGLTAFRIVQDRNGLTLKGRWTVPGHNVVLPETLTKAR